MTMPVPAPSPSTWNGPCCWTTWVEIDTVDGSTAATTAGDVDPAGRREASRSSTAGVEVRTAAESSPVCPATYPAAAPAATAASVNAAAAANRLRRGAALRRGIGAGGGADGGGPGGEETPGGGTEGDDRR